MTTLRLERFDTDSNTSEIMGRFEINDIECDAFRLDAFIMNRVDASTDMKVLDIGQVSDWFDNPDDSLLIVASSDTATFVLRVDKTKIMFNAVPEEIENFSGLIQCCLWALFGRVQQLRC